MEEAGLVNGPSQDGSCEDGVGNDEGLGAGDVNGTACSFQASPELGLGCDFEDWIAVIFGFFGLQDELLHLVLEDGVGVFVVIGSTHDE